MSAVQTNSVQPPSPTQTAEPPTEGAPRPFRGRILTAERARELLEYEPESGILRRRPEAMRPGRFADVVKTVDKDGYLLVKLDGYAHRAHRVIFLMMTGRWPHPTCDHISRNTLDNRWCNLREADFVTQNFNRRVLSVVSKRRKRVRKPVPSKPRLFSICLAVPATPEEGAAIYSRIKKQSVTELSTALRPSARHCAISAPCVACLRVQFVDEKIQRASSRPVLSAPFAAVPNLPAKAPSVASRGQRAAWGGLRHG